MLLPKVTVRPGRAILSMKNVAACRWAVLLEHYHKLLAKGHVAGLLTLRLSRQYRQVSERRALRWLQLHLRPFQAQCLAKTHTCVQKQQCYIGERIRASRKIHGLLSRAQNALAVVFTSNHPNSGYPLDLLPFVSEAE